MAANPCAGQCHRQAVPWRIARCLLDNNERTGNLAGFREGRKPGRRWLR